MKRFKLLFSIFLVISIFIIMGISCRHWECLEVPEEYSDAPFAELEIYYRDSSNQPVHEKVNTTDHNSPVTVTVPGGKEFKMTVHGTDMGCVKEMALHFKYYVNIGGIQQLIQPMISPNDYSDCPRQSRTLDETYEWENQSRTYKFHARVTDFHGNSSSTPKITVLHHY